MAKKKLPIHYAVNYESEAGFNCFYMYACGGGHGFSEPFGDEDNITTTKSRVTCRNCKRTRAWKESK